MVSWGDYLFTATVRALGGGLVGPLGGCLIGYRWVLKRLAHDDLRPVVFFVVACALVGAAVGVWTIPRWQTPWYKGHDRDRWE